MEEVPGQTAWLAGYEPAVLARIERIAAERLAGRLWQRDASLWTDDAEGSEVIRNSLGWLDVAERMQTALREIEAFAEEVRGAGFKHFVYMGMGGSSLCPLVFERSFKPGSAGLPVMVLDSTDPTTVLAVERAVPLQETLFFVASKSGTTAEPHAFGEYFYHRLRELSGGEAGANMAVVTDPGSRLAGIAAERSYRHTFLNFADIGGRFSALSFFGMVPAVLMGLDASALLAGAVSMAEECRRPEAENPGVLLGAIMGELALAGRDKVTLVVPEELETLGAWLEQLIAESTGKQGKGLLPVAAEPLGEPEDYGNDRLFVHLRLKDDMPGEDGQKIAALSAAGHPLVTIEIAGSEELGREFYRWEIATATAGAVLGINPFDQPNVQESKDYTNRLLEVVSREGALPAMEPDLVETPFAFFGTGESTGAGAIKAFLGRAQPGDYIGLLVFLTEEAATDDALRSLRLAVRGKTGLATTCGYGPRYLHSTGQLHKGGPDTGNFIMLTADEAEDATIPGVGYGFSAFRNAQAEGDLMALKNHGRKVLRIHLGADVNVALARLADIIAAE